jgi:hypothetical protein
MRCQGRELSASDNHWSERVCVCAREIQNVSCFAAGGTGECSWDER